MSKNTGKELEKLVGRVYELLNTEDSNITVEVDVLIESPDGPRQFDVVIKAQIAESELLTVVEVRDWKKRLSISHVDGFVSKMQDVDADKGILVSRYGFQKSAIRKAKRMHIDICTAHHLENLKDFRVQFPVVGVHCRGGRNDTLRVSLQSLRTYNQFWDGRRIRNASYDKL